MTNTILFSAICLKMNSIHPTKKTILIENHTTNCGIFMKNQNKLRITS